MKTLTITISDEAAQALAQTAEQTRRPQEEVAAQAVEETFGPDWFDELDDVSQAAVLQGVAEADREEFATDDAVSEAFARFKR
jgi:predicted transcriptional regulator